MTTNRGANDLEIDIARVTNQNGHSGNGASPVIYGDSKDVLEPNDYDKFTIRGDIKKSEYLFDLSQNHSEEFQMDDEDIAKFKMKQEQKN